MTMAVNDTYCHFKSLQELRQLTPHAAGHRWNPV